MYYTVREASLLLGVKIVRLKEHVATRKIGRWTRAPKKLMLSDRDLLAIWQDDTLMVNLRKTLWELRPKVEKQKRKYTYKYVYRYRPYKRIPLEQQKPRGGKRPGAGRKKNENPPIRFDRGNPWGELLKREGIYDRFYARSED